MRRVSFFSVSSIVSAQRAPPTPPAAGGLVKLLISMKLANHHPLRAAQSIRWRLLKPNTWVLVFLLLAIPSHHFFMRISADNNDNKPQTTHTFGGRVDMEGDDGEGADSRSSATKGAAVFEASNRPLVAVYFTGQARTLHRTICSIRRHLFAPLVRQGFTPVVFVVGESDGNEAGDDPSVSPNYTIRSTISIAATCTACGVRLIIL